jgi:hypothetical protein
VVFAAHTGAIAEEPAPPDSTYTGEHCSVTCGRFKEDTCEIWDEAGAPSCECTIGDIGAYTCRWQRARSLPLQQRAARGVRLEQSPGRLRELSLSVLSGLQQTAATPAPRERSLRLRFPG